MNSIEVMLDEFLIEAEKLCDIKFVYLFGSYARKENNKKVMFI